MMTLFLLVSDLNIKSKNFREEGIHKNNEGLKMATVNNR